MIYMRGDLVFWHTEKKPRWVLEYQTHVRSVTVIVLIDSEGNIAAADPDEVRPATDWRRHR